MILGKLWHAIASQFNKLANAIRGYDPIAQMQYEYDRSIEQMKEGREGLAQYRALVERVTRQVDNQRKQVATIEAKIKAYLEPAIATPPPSSPSISSGPRTTWPRTRRQLALHEQAYNNNLLKIKHAIQKLEDVKHKITKYDADLKMSRAEAEMSQLATQFNFNVTTDFGQAEQVLQDQIDRNRGRVRVAADLSGEGVEDVKREIAVEKTMAEDALKEFEKEMGLATPATAQSAKQLGPATRRLEPLPEI